ncbi:MAG TPA: dihydrodipicolinate synthase family protein [Agriterribacter sp.]|nr:dihydrodipicolinate synthase family protein [Agriterribacter sp.]
MMKELYPLSGIITVLNTPFDGSGSLDEPSLRRNVKMALDAGVAGFLVPAMASEVHRLTTVEKLKMVDIVMDETAGRVPVFAGAGTTDMSAGLEMLNLYQRLGCKQVLIQLPFTTANDFKNSFRKLCDAGPETIMLQDWDAQGYGLPDELLLELFETVTNFRCLKIETVPAGVKYSRLRTLTQGRLHLSGGWAVMQMIEGLTRGLHAFMPTGMHYIYTHIYRAYHSGDKAKAEDIFNKVLPVLAFSNQHLDISIHFFKRLLHKQGIYSTAMVRQPIQAFDAIHEAIADRLIDQVLHLEDQLKRGNLHA